MNKTPILYLVIPCYNEQEVLGETVKRLEQKLNFLTQGGKIDQRSRMLFVDDGSRDTTWSLICEHSEKSEWVAGAKLSRNRGHQNALLAGLTVALEKADVTISLDADLQDDLDAIDAMMDKFLQGRDVVYGVRNDRTTDTAFKRVTAQGFYRFMKSMGVDTVYNHADYRLLSHRALSELLRFDESNLFLRGMVPLVGFSSDVVQYKRGERFAGESKYPLKKMIAFAVDGITSFSTKPLTLPLTLGVMLGFGSVVALVVFLVLTLLGNPLPLTAWLLACVWLCTAILLFCMGVLGQYIGKTYLESKHRPRFIIEQIVNR